MQSKYCRPSSTRPESQKGDINGLVATTVHGISRTPNLVDAFCRTYGGQSLYFTFAYMPNTAHPTKTLYWNPPLTTSAWNSPPYPRAARNAHARKTLTKFCALDLQSPISSVEKSFSAFSRCPFCAYPAIFVFGGTKFRSAFSRVPQLLQQAHFADFLQACNSRKPRFTWVSCETASGFVKTSIMGISCHHLIPRQHTFQAFSQTPSVPHRQTQCVNNLQLMYPKRPHLIEAFYQTDRVQTLYFHILHKRQQGNPRTDLTWTHN